MNQKQAAKLRECIEEYKHAWEQLMIAPAYMSISEYDKVDRKYNAAKARLDKLLDKCTSS